MQGMQEGSFRSKGNWNTMTTDAQLGADLFWREIDVMEVSCCSLRYRSFAESCLQTVRGYYSCASSRFVDTICCDVQAELLAICPRNLSVDP